MVRIEDLENGLDNLVKMINDANVKSIDSVLKYRDLWLDMYDKYVAENADYPERVTYAYNLYGIYTECESASSLFNSL